MKNYTIKLIITVITLFSLLGITNYIIDPYDHFKTLSFNKINKLKSITHDKRREAYENINLIKPKTLVLGTSRSLMGFNDSILSKLEQPLVNASVERASIHEIYAYFNYAIEQAPIKNVILTLDFFNFNTYLEPLPSFEIVEKLMKNENTFKIKILKKLNLLFSKDAFYKSFKTLLMNNKKNIDNSFTFIDSMQLSNKTERALITTHVFYPLPYKKFDFRNTSIDSFDIINSILKKADEKKISIKLVILPIHTRLLSLIKEIGLIDKYECWYKMIAELGNSYPVYDLSSLETLTQISPSSEKFNEWYYETLHFNSKLGKVIIDKIDDSNSSEIRLNSRNADRKFLETTNSIVNYYNNYPDEYLMLKDTIKYSGLNHNQT